MTSPIDPSSDAAEARKRPTLAAIRDATRSSHRALEATVGPILIESRSFQIDEYCRFLEAHARLHRTVADAVADAASFSLLDWPNCVRIPALAHDLELLHASGLLSDMGAAVFHEGLDEPHLVSYLDPAGQPIVEVRPAHVAGLTYVVEGSCLGNRQILTALREHDAFHELGVQAYLSTSTNVVGTRWKATVEVVEHHGAHDIEGVIAGALAGFTAFGRYWRHVRSSVWSVPAPERNALPQRGTGSPVP